MAETVTAVYYFGDRAACSKTHYTVWYVLAGLLAHVVCTLMVTQTVYGANTKTLLTQGVTFKSMRLLM